MKRPGEVIDPLDALVEDRGRARERGDPCASLCTLATVDEGGHPHARTVVLREVEGRLAVFCNATSPKWQQIERCPSLALVVWLPSLDLQYRLQCTTRPVPREVLQRSWQLRPDAPKRLDWFYTRVQPQSSAIDSRSSLLEGVSGLQLREPLTPPRTAAGVYLEPTLIERLDLGVDDGIHDRKVYRHHPGGWREITLVP